MDLENASNIEVLKGRDPGAFIKKPVENCTWRNTSLACLLYL